MTAVFFFLNGVGVAIERGSIREGILQIADPISFSRVPRQHRIFSLNRDTNAETCRTYLRRAGAAQACPRRAQSASRVTRLQ